MFENIFNISITLKIPTGEYVDGKPQFNEIPAKAFRTEKSTSDLNLFGSVNYDRVYLVDTTIDIPNGSEIVDGDDVTTVTASRPCRGVDGSVWFMRVGSA